MSNISDILLAIRSLDVEDLKVFAETSKKCITEETRRRLDAIPTIPEEDEAREISVSQTYPFIYISNDDLKKATYKLMPNRNGQPDSIQFTQDLANPVVATNPRDVSIVCAKFLGNGYSAEVNGSHCGSPPCTTLLKINNNRHDEKVVFILSRDFSFQQCTYTYSIAKVVVITNFANICIGHRSHQIQSGCQSYQQPSYPTATSKMINQQPIEIVANDIEIDEFCRVPQIFIDLMCFTLRSFGVAYTNSDTRIQVDNEEFFKTLCRSYNKDRREMRNKITALEKANIVLQKREQTLEKEQEDTIKTFAESVETLVESHTREVDDLINQIAKERLENSILCDKIKYLADISATAHARLFIQ